jgi:hypothetical protein
LGEGFPGHLSGLVEQAKTRVQELGRVPAPGKGKKGQRLAERIARLMDAVHRKLQATWGSEAHRAVIERRERAEESGAEADEPTAEAVLRGFTEFTGLRKTAIGPRESLPRRVGRWVELGALIAEAVYLPPWIRDWAWALERLQVVYSKLRGHPLLAGITLDLSVARFHEERGGGMDAASHLRVVAAPASGDPVRGDPFPAGGRRAASRRAGAGGRARGGSS